MKYEVSAKMHVYIEVNEKLTESEIQAKFYKEMESLQDKNKHLSFTIHEVEQYEQ